MRLEWRRLDKSDVFLHREEVYNKNLKDLPIVVETGEAEIKKITQRITRRPKDYKAPVLATRISRVWGY